MREKSPVLVFVFLKRNDEQRKVYKNSHSISDNRVFVLKMNMLEYMLSGVESFPISQNLNKFKMLIMNVLCFCRFPEN
jgi:hypothetical protein